MSAIRLTAGFVLIMVSIALNSATIRLEQKKGLWQNQTEKQIKPTEFKRLDLDFKKMPLKLVRKIMLHDDKIFILDNRRSELYVADKSGKHLYTIGRPGQGPGDIEYGWDFFITGDKVYVLSNMSRRISTFKINGEATGIIKLDDIGGLSLPTSIGIDKDSNIIIGGAFDPVLTLYSPDGKFKKNLISKSDMVAYKKTPPKIGIPSSINFADDSIIHFDMFKGAVTKVSPAGEIEFVFSPYRDYIQRSIRETEDESRHDSGRSIITNWSHFTIDQSGNIYVLSTIKKEDVPQDIFVFSKQGELLYLISLDFFFKERIRHFSVSKGVFVFLTIDYECFLAK